VDQRNKGKRDARYEIIILKSCMKIKTTEYEGSLVVTVSREALDYLVTGKSETQDSHLCHQSTR